MKNRHRGTVTVSFDIEDFCEICEVTARGHAEFLENIESAVLAILKVGMSFVVARGKTVDRRIEWSWGYEGDEEESVGAFLTCLTCSLNHSVDSGEYMRMVKDGVFRPLWCEGEKEIGGCDC